tara:strand:- start:2354 stop:2725 length:372 start_codon:yes stop_codon:yes gene_type:complete
VAAISECPRGTLIGIIGKRVVYVECASHSEMDYELSFRVPTFVVDGVGQGEEQILAPPLKAADSIAGGVTGFGEFWRGMGSSADDGGTDDHWFELAADRFDLGKLWHRSTVSVDYWRSESHPG